MTEAHSAVTAAELDELVRNAAQRKNIDPAEATVLLRRMAAEIDALRRERDELRAGNETLCDLIRQGLMQRDRLVDSIAKKDAALREIIALDYTRSATNGFGWKATQIAEAALAPAAQGTVNWTMPMPSGEPGSYPAPAPAPSAGETKWLPIESAPKDGTMLRLLVQFTEHATDDSLDPCATIGMNNLDHDGEDVWKFAGWDWCQDCFTQGEGAPVGWLPFIAAAPAPSAGETSEQMRAELRHVRAVARQAQADGAMVNPADLAWPAPTTGEPTAFPSPVCQMCDGNGEIGGFDQNKDTWRKPCPECAPADTSSELGAEKLLDWLIASVRAEISNPAHIAILLKQAEEDRPASTSPLRRKTLSERIAELPKGLSEAEYAGRLTASVRETVSIAAAPTTGEPT